MYACSNQQDAHMRRAHPLEPGLEGLNFMGPCVAEMLVMHRAGKALAHFCVTVTCAR